MKKPLVVVIGPTASGKTDLAIQIAKHLDSFVLSADSMQIYKGVETISAAPTKAEMQGIKHYLVGELEPDMEFSVGDFVKRAEDIIELEGDKIPVVCGGTGLYISSLIDGVSFDKVSSDEKVREELKAELSVKGAEAMHRMLSEIDAQSGEEIHPNNTVRVLRALEVYRVTGIPMSVYKKMAKPDESEYDAYVVALNYQNRDVLYDRIDKRVDIMMENGMLDEARTLLKGNPSNTLIQAIGLKEFRDYFSGGVSLEECLDKIKQSSRRYAKRQITWIKKMKNVNWYYPDNYVEKNDMYKEIIGNIDEFLKIKSY